MPPIPDLNDFIFRHHAYQMFISYAVLLAVPVAWWLVRSPGAGYRFPIPTIWHSVAIGAALRWLPMHQDYWYDETFTSAVVSRSPGDMWTVISGDVHPPLYYLLVKMFTWLPGDSDLLMRLPAFLAGLALIVVVSRIAYTWTKSVRVSQWSALLTAILPAAVYYSTEARYPMFLALVLAAALLALLKGRHGLMAMALTVAALTHVNSWFYVVVLAGWVIVTRRQWLAVSLPLVAIGAWLPVAVSQSADVSDGFWLMQSTPIRYLVDMTITTKTDLPLSLLLVLVAGVCAILISSAWSWSKSGQVSWLWIILVAVIPAIQWSIGVVWHPVYLERTLIISAVLWLIPVAWWLEHRARISVTLLYAITIGLTLFSIATGDRSKADEAIAACGSSPIIYAVTTYSAIQATHYSDSLVIAYRNGNSTAQQLPTSSRNALWLLLDPGRIPAGVCVLAQVDAYTTDDQYQHLEQITGNRHQVIPVNTHSYYVVSVK